MKCDYAWPQMISVFSGFSLHFLSHTATTKEMVRLHSLGHAEKISPFRWVGSRGMAGLVCQVWSWPSPVSRAVWCHTRTSIAQSTIREPLRTRALVAARPQDWGKEGQQTGCEVRNTGSQKVEKLVSQHTGKVRSLGCQTNQRELATTGVHSPHFTEWGEGHWLASACPHHQDSPHVSHSFKSSAKATTCVKGRALCLHRPYS